VLIFAYLFNYTLKEPRIACSVKAATYTGELETSSQLVRNRNPGFQLVSN